MQMLEAKIRNFEAASMLARSGLLMPLIWQLFEVLRILAVSK